MIDLLNGSIQTENYGEIERATNGLVSLNSKQSVPKIIEALRKFYPRATDAYRDSAQDLCIKLMKALNALGATESCVLLAEIAVKNPALTYSATETSNTLCK